MGPIPIGPHSLDALLEAVARGDDPGPFALLRREAAGELPDHLDLLTGDVSTVSRLADIPLPAGPGPATLALVPFRQIVERGFACVDDGAPLRCLRVRAASTVPLAEALAALPDEPVGLTGGAFDISDAEYADIVTAVLRDEIGRGEGANFVIHRVYEARVNGNPLRAALAALRRLLVGERGAYWTFLVHTGDRTLVGATPERHVSACDGLVMMNPISGTHRHGPAGPDAEELLRFLADPKEIDELYMVLDEELKMMATVADHGGQVVGPYLKEMAHLTHTEYLLAGRGARDVRDVLRETMFAPTVTGSPIENALRVIARHERRGRGYYAGVLALLGHDETGRQTLDAPILIRTADFSPDGLLRVPVGATLVRHSTAAGEVAETHTKAAGVLTALGLRPPAGPVATAGSRPAGATAISDVPAVSEVPAGPRLADDPRVRAALAARNDRLARFWLDERGAVRADSADPADSAERADGTLAGRRVLIVDAEDTFTGMLSHQLRSLGLTVTVLPYSDPAVDLLTADVAASDVAAADVAAPDVAAPDVAAPDLVVAGPGPGDPEDPDDPKMAVLRALVAGVLRRGQPLLGVCLGHQILSGLLGLRIHRRTQPYQGLQREVEMFGSLRRVGFYSTFTPLSDVDFLATPYGVAALARDHVDGSVHALRGPRFAGVQFHPESVLSPDGVDVLRELVAGLLPAAAYR